MRAQRIATAALVWLALAGWARADRPLQRLFRWQGVGWSDGYHVRSRHAQSPGLWDPYGQLRFARGHATPPGWPPPRSMAPAPKLRPPTPQVPEPRRRSAPQRQEKRPAQPTKPMEDLRPLEDQEPTPAIGSLRKPRSEPLPTPTDLPPPGEPESPYRSPPRKQ